MCDSVIRVKLYKGRLLVAELLVADVRHLLELLVVREDGLEGFLVCVRCVRCVRLSVCVYRL